MLILFLIGSVAVSAQELTKEHVDEFVQKTFATNVLDYSIIYLLNGYLFESNELNNELRKFDVSQLYMVAFWDFDLVERPFCRTNFDAMILLRARKHKRGDIKKLLKEAVSKFEPEKDGVSDINTDNRLPALLINGAIVPNTDSFETISKLDTKKIIGITIIDQPVSHELYGENGANGLIIVYQKE